MSELGGNPNAEIIYKTLGMKKRNNRFHYRSISLLSSLGNVFEKLHKRLLEFRKENILTSRNDQPIHFKNNSNLSREIQMKTKRERSISEQLRVMTFITTSICEILHSSLSMTSQHECNVQNFRDKPLYPN